MSIRSRSARLAAFAVLAIATVACTKTLDTEGLEPQLLKQAEAKTGQAFRSVSCPDDVKPETGHQFNCEAVDEDGTIFTMQVTQIDDMGRVEWELVGAAAEA